MLALPFSLSFLAITLLHHPLLQPCVTTGPKWQGWGTIG